jgi:hypothetical protein
MAKIIDLERPKPASRPEVIEFIRELLIYAYANEVNILIAAMKSADGMEAHGVILPGETSRNVDRLLDLTEAWVSEWEYEAEDD